MKLPKPLFEACQKKDINNIRQFICNDKLGRYSCWAKPIIKNFGFQLFKDSLLLWNHKLFKKYQQNLHDEVFLNACAENNEDCQKYIIENKIQFTDENVFNLKHLFESINKEGNTEQIKENSKIFVKELVKINTNMISLFKPENYYFGSINAAFYKKEYGKQLQKYFNLKFEQKHLDSFLHSSSLFLDYNSCKHWLKQGADIELKSIQETKDKPFWAFDSRNLIHFLKGKGFLGQEQTFETLLEFATPKQLSIQNQLWKNTATILIKQFDNIDAKQTIKLAIQKNADFSYDLFKNELQAAKFIEEYFSYNSIRFLNEWSNNGKNNTKLIQMVFKEAVINGRNEMCKELIEQGYSPKDFIKSQAFNNIREGGSLIEKKKKYLQEHIEKSRNIVNSFSLQQELTDSLNTNVAPKPCAKLKI